MTYKCLSLGQNHREYHSFSRWPKYIKLSLSADESCLVAVAATDGTRTRFQKGQSRKNKSLTSRTLHTLKNFIENTPLTGEAIWATLDMCSFCTNIPQEEEIEIVCHHYEEHCQSNLPIPSSYLENLMRLILRENQFKFNGKHYVQTHGTCNGHQNGGSCFLGHFHGSLW